MAGLRFEGISGDEGMALFDLILSVDESDDQLTATLEYDQDLFDRSTIERMAGDYRRALEGIVADPEMHVGDLPLRILPNDRLDARVRPPESGPGGERTNSFVASRTLVEKQLAEIWSSLLAVERVGIHDDFFELGGHSLLAAQMLFRTQNFFGKNLPLGAFFQEPTIHQLARALTWGPASRSSFIVPFRPQGTRKPFFCIHPLGGSVLCYFSLARHLDAGQPFYAVRAPELDGEREPLGRIEGMAACYVEAIQEIQPEGPYLLGGWSLGGVIAFEMARQFHEQGERVALVALLDTEPPSSARSNQPDDAALLAEIASDLNVPVSRKILERLAPSERLDYVVRQATEQHGETEVIRQTVDRYFITCKAQERALASYHPPVYPGTVTLFRCKTRNSTSLNERANGWDGLVEGGVQIHAVPGSHQTMIAEPRVRILARKLQVCINAALASG
jgi:thioesterase domain-containing protein